MAKLEESELSLKVLALQKRLVFFIPKVTIGVVVIWIILGFLAPSVDRKGSGMEFFLIAGLVFSELLAIVSVLSEVVKRIERPD